MHLLLSNHCDVNAVDQANVTALHVAAQKGHTKIVEMLLDYHINSRFFKTVHLEEEIQLNV